jgi:hypothetical protein
MHTGEPLTDTEQKERTFQPRTIIPNWQTRHECGLSSWRGHPLTLRLDHIDGNPRNYSLLNLRLLCPNCDSQQPTYCHKNVGKIHEGV